MKQVRKRITYANVMSSIAVFLVLGGATAFAASKIGANQLKANSVLTGKIKKEAITTSKLKKNAVTGVKVKDGSLTGSDINLGTLGTVPSATKAAKTEQIAHIFYTGKKGAAKTTILNFGGLVLSETCGEVNDIEATTTVSHAVIDVVTAQDTDNGSDIDFNVGDSFNADLGHSEGDVEAFILQYTRPDGIDVVVNFHDVDAEDGGVFPGTPQQADCLVSGIATSN